jgi:hypothetical protein
MNNPKKTKKKGSKTKARDLKAKKNPKAGTGIGPMPVGPAGPGG